MQNGMITRLKKSYRSVKKHLDEPNVSDWIYDNFYLIDRRYHALMKNKKALSDKPIFDLLFSCCEDYDFSPSPKSIASRIANENEEFGYFALESIREIICACAIIKIGESLESNSGTDILPNAVKLLNSVSDPEYSDILPRVWAPEKIISSFEPKYESFSSETKVRYRRAVSAIAKRKRENESQTAKRLTETAKKQGCLLGNLLFTPDVKYIVFWLVSAVVVFSALSLLSFSLIGWTTCLLLIPFGIASGSIADILVSRIMQNPSVPRIELDSVPDDAKTLVTVAALITGEKNDERVFDSLVKFRYMNPDENIYFCLLADLPDAETPYMPRDNEIIGNAYRRIDEINRLHGDRFCIFFRERVFNKSESSYGGWERKRGAVCELVYLIVNGDKREFRGGDFIRDIKYIVTLDSDTNLSVGSVKELLSVALHPLNRPQTVDGKIVSGYGIVQPSVRTELKSAYKSAFSRLISGSGGADVYSGASFSRKQSLLGFGTFCGKGLIDVTLFESMICGKFPEGLILSHDVLEGNILRTLAATDITLTDSTPANPVSYFRRHHRWMRGDFQNLVFLFNRRFDILSKFGLLAVALRHLSPIGSLAAILFSCFAKNTNGLALILLACVEFLLPFAVNCIAVFFSGAPFACVRFFSKACSSLTQNALRVFFEITSLCRRAILALDALVLASIRLCTRRKTLEWTTAAQTERLSSTLGKYVLDGTASVIFGVFLLVFARPSFIRLIGLFFFAYPLVSVVLSRNIGGGGMAHPHFTKKQKELLITHAEDMFGFYYDNVNDRTNHLPPDNIQFSPVSDIALRTSPTNIGFYLVSLLASRDLGIVNTNELCDRLEYSIDSVERLEKHKGNLYNWYSLSDLSVIGDRYISSVDSGNFVVMLVALKEGLREYSHENERIRPIIERVEALIRNTDLTVFYDSRRELFCIGIRNDGKKDGCFYDMLMSEARMTAYYAVAASVVPKRHWQSLGRTLTHKSGYIGMKSWSGTAFEYFMPQLFLPLYRDSFMYESLAFALAAQRGENRIWGVSESGFYSFDSEMRYQYKANGLQTLALRRIGSNEKTVSPYSTYLSLCICSTAAIKNLQELENRGMYGRYGLYEALDLNIDQNGACVKSYMAHHVGMSIIAIMNAVCDNIFVRRFTSDIKMASAHELLQEKIPTDAHVFEEDAHREREAKRPISAVKSISSVPDLSSPNSVLLSKGDLSAIVTSSGHVAVNCGDRAITNTVFDQDLLRFSLGVTFSRSGNVFGCAPLYCKEGKSFEIKSDSVSHIASGKDFSGRVQYAMSKSSSCMIISTRAEALKSYDVTLSFEPVLESEKKFSSHISFSRLFIESEYDAQKRILYFHRRSGDDGRHIFTLAVAPYEKSNSFSFLTSRESLSASSVASPLDYAFIPTDNSVGACIDPLCLVRSADADGGKATFLITCGQTKRECERNIGIARADKAFAPIKHQSKTEAALLTALLYGKGDSAVDAFPKCNVFDLWAKGISGDFPFAVVCVSEIAKKRIASILDAYLSLANSMIRCELIFIVSDADGYNRPVERAIYESCEKANALQYIGKSGGIFILRRDGSSVGLIGALKSHSSFYYDLSCPLPKNRFSGCFESGQTVITPKNDVKLSLPESAVAAGNGFFANDSYTVDKSVMPKAPYSFVLTGKRFSAVITQSSLGYTFYDNARERRLCSFYGDPRSLDNGERVFMLSNGNRFDLCAVSSKVVYGKGKAVFFGNVDGIDYTLTVCVDPKYPIKLIRVQYPKGVTAETRFVVEPVMGDSVGHARNISFMRFSSGNNSALLFKNTFGMTFPEGIGFAGACGGELKIEEKTLSCNSGDALFFLGATTSESGAKKIISLINKKFFEGSLQSAALFAESMIPKIKISTRSAATDALMNFFLPYQVAACRMYARGSFYQSGGAYGFRDQLQDCLTLIYSDPNLVRTHIFRCCAHQYLEGDVMHWWHTRHINRVNNGIRSKCSDDLLYLPYVVADYIEKTGDYKMLDIGVKYLSSPPLGSKSERYELPTRSDVKESVYLHCLRALARAEQTGKHGLILMGSCDWNDAFSLVGEKGVGESVFSTLLFIIVAERFIPIAEARKDFETASHYRETVKALRRAVEDNAFFGDRYARAFCDDGKILGIEGCKECEIDILSQAFAALAGLDRERTKIALQTAFSKLYDSKNRIFKLFSPPFVNGKARVGYIRGYVAGIRENGGQYTHGALWGALGFLAVGMTEEALTVLECANPATRCNDKELADRYKTEPYAIAADIYSGDRSGRGGWSWYTGAASWFYRIMLEHVLGLKFGAGNTLLSASPLIAFKAEITLNKANLHITATRDATVPTVNGEEASFPLRLQDGEHDICLPIK